MVITIYENHLLNHQPEKPNKKTPQKCLCRRVAAPMASPGAIGRQPTAGTAKGHGLSQPCWTAQRWGKIQFGQRKKMWVGCSYSCFFKYSIHSWCVIVVSSRFFRNRYLDVFLWVWFVLVESLEWWDSRWFNHMVFDDICSIEEIMGYNRIFQQLCSKVWHYDGMMVSAIVNW